MKNSKNFGRRGLSLLLSLVICLGMLPGTALAADTHDHGAGVPDFKCPYDPDCPVVYWELAREATCQSPASYYVSWDCGQFEWKYYSGDKGDHVWGPDGLCIYGCGTKDPDLAEPVEPTEPTEPVEPTEPEIPKPSEQHCVCGATLTGKPGTPVDGTYHAVTCDNCGQVTKINHNMGGGNAATAITPEVKATCTTSGNYAYYQCVDCKGYVQAGGGTRSKLFQEGEWVIPANLHKYTDTWDWTEKDNGSATVTITCSLCNDTHTETVSADKKSDGKPATCTAGETFIYSAHYEYTDTLNRTYTFTGKTSTEVKGTHSWKLYDQGTDNIHYAKCERCGLVDMEQSSEHNWDDGVVKAAATCTSPAEYEFTCTICGRTRTEAVGEALGHNYKDEWTWENVTCVSATANLVLTCTREGCPDHDIPVEIAQIGKNITLGADGRFTAVVEDGDGKQWTGTSDFTIADYHNVTDTTPWENRGETHAQKCDTCGAYLNEAAHDYSEEWTADETSHKEYAECGVCGDRIWRDLAHKWDEGTVTKQPTCTETGEKTFHCAYCSETYTEEVPMIPHEMIRVAEKSATCLEDGMAEHRECVNCGGFFTGNSYTSMTKVEKADLVIPAKGHNLVDDEAIPATCTTDGLTAGKHCDRDGCDYVETAQAVIPALGHNYETVVTDPTCTEDGYTTYTCSRCGDSYADDMVEALDHDWGNWTVITAPTTENAGLARRICANDNSHVEEETLDRLPTTPGDIDPAGEWTLAATVDPTCEEDGYYEYTHSVTGLSARVIRAALGHVWDDGVVTRRPTSAVDGIMTYTCERCGETRTESIPFVSTNPTLPAPDPDEGGEGGGTGTGNNTVTINEEGTPLADLPFEDVLPTDWFYEAVMYVYNRGLMNGVSDTLFDPYGILNRAMVVTILYRVEGEPEATPSSFLDVEAGKWYTDAIGWGAANGIVEGYSEEKFGPMDPVTREQLAAILYRYAQYKGYDVTDSVELNDYTDASAIHEYAVEAMQWALAIGAPTALDGMVISPRENATRAQVAESFMNFCEKYVPLATEGEAA